MNKYNLGTNGFVYAGGRKGEDLFKLLIDDPEISDKFNFMASGRGWIGIKTTGYSWSDMQNFYKKLDLYVSTSIIEGIGYGVLEALACGIPVVIPKDVGVYDELPNAENLYRYKANDYNSLKKAVLAAYEDISTNHVNRDSLRAITARFTLDSWISDHVLAFEKLLYGVKYQEPKHDGKSGIYYVAYGQPARECFIRALTSVRKYLGDFPVCLVSDSRVETDLDYIFIEYPDNDIGARGNKTLIYELAPKEWEYVLYLDSDTEIISEDVTFIFDVLKDGFEFVICTNPNNYILVRDMLRPDNEEEIAELTKMLGTDEMLQYNGGVFAFRRCDTTEKLLNGWHEEWLVYGKRDQAALDRVLYNLPVRIYTLGVEWNTVTRYLPAERSAAILHYPMQARRWKGRIDGRLDSSEEWARLHPSE